MQFTAIIFIALIVISFITFSISIIFIRKTKKDILRKIKVLDYSKWRYITSFSSPLLNRLKGLIWLNPLRFARFMKSANHFNSHEISILREKCRRYKKYAIISYVIFLLAILIILCGTLVYWKHDSY